MSIVNINKQFCYRIAHVDNLPILLRNGLVSKNHHMADSRYIQIGHPEIIDVRSSTPVKITGYGNIGDYVPFYFTPKSMMLFNILTGYRHPVVQKRERNEIMVIRCLIAELANLPKWFFTDGQANDITSSHYNDLNSLSTIDWPCIQHGNFRKADGDYDRPRRYQAEFLVYQEVPLQTVDSLNVYNDTVAITVKETLAKYNAASVPVNIQPHYFF